MNNVTGRVNKQSRLMGEFIDSLHKEERDKPQKHPQIPAYLEETYWWAYMRPNAVSFFERQWIVNLILLGNFVKLRDAALNELGTSVQGRTIQIACVYGDFSMKLAQRVAVNSTLEIVDVLPIQLENVRRKLLSLPWVRIHQSDSVSLKFEDETYDQAVMFFLLHEMPASVREKTLHEAIRVLKPGGKLVIVDFHKPSIWNPLRYFYPLLFKVLEPFALDIWKERIEEWLPEGFVPTKITTETFLGGMYQKVVIRK